MEGLRRNWTWFMCESFKEVAFNQLEVEPGSAQGCRSKKEAPALWESGLAHVPTPVALTESPIKSSPPPLTLAHPPDSAVKYRGLPRERRVESCLYAQLSCNTRTTLVCYQWLASWRVGPGFLNTAKHVNAGALIIKVGPWGRLYYSYTKEPPTPYSNYEGPYMGYRRHRYYSGRDQAQTSMVHVWAQDSPKSPLYRMVFGP